MSDFNVEAARGRIREGVSEPAGPDGYHDLQTLAYACDEIVYLRRQRDEALALVRRLEWSERSELCPDCNAWKPEGHAVDCALAALLAHAGGDQQ